VLAISRHGPDLWHVPVNGRKPSTGIAMAFEYPTPAGVVRLFGTSGGWFLQYRGRRRGEWHTPDAAAIAVARHQTGLPSWDREQVAVPDDLLDWRPLGDSL
jgi:hypothetical protein